MDEKKKEADSVSHFSAERIFGFGRGKKCSVFRLKSDIDRGCTVRRFPRRWY